MAFAAGTVIVKNMFGNYFFNDGGGGGGGGGGRGGRCCGQWKLGSVFLSLFFHLRAYFHLKKKNISNVMK